MKEKASNPLDPLEMAQAVIDYAQASTPKQIAEWFEEWAGRLIDTLVLLKSENAKFARSNKHLQNSANAGMQLGLKLRKYEHEARINARSAISRKLVEEATAEYLALSIVQWAMAAAALLKESEEDQQALAAEMLNKAYGLGLRASEVTPEKMAVDVQVTPMSVDKN